MNARQMMSLGVMGAWKSGMPAATLEDAFNILDPKVPIQPDQVATLFVQREASDAARMLGSLRTTRKPVKLLFCGHRGAGKSSELSYLSSQAGGEFLSVPVPVYRIFQSPSVNYAEVVLAMNLRLLRMATDESIFPRGKVNQVWEDYLQDVYKTTRRWLFGESSAGEAQVADVTVKLNTWVAELETKIGVESTSRKSVSDHLQDRISDCVQQIDAVVAQLESKLKKRLLILVEDLDKFDLQPAQDLFLQHSGTLTLPRVHIVYTFPVPLRYTNDFPEIQRGFDGTFFLGNIALNHRDGTFDQAGWAAARDILVRRVSESLFEPTVLDEVIKFSGGHVTSLIRLAQDAALNAIVAGQTKVSIAHLRAAAARIRDDYIALLRRPQIELLKSIRANAKRDLDDLDEAKQQLLYNGSLLEYRNTLGPWGDVHPIVTDILDR